MEYRVRKRNIEETSGGVARLDDMLTDALLRRFHLRAGFTTTSARSLQQTRNFLGDFLEKLLDAVIVLMGHHNRRTILLTDVLRACSHYGIRLYGYDDMCVLESPWGITEYHVTEMVEVNTTFNRHADSDEPDFEPSAHYKKTDFVQNQRAWDADDEEEEDSGDDSEWSWYSESDADSDCEDDDDALEAEPPAQAVSRWHRGEDPKEVFLRSLQAAQAVVDEQLLIDEPDAESMESDTPFGQGYDSDCDSSRVVDAHQDWKVSAEGEEAKWESKGNVTEYEESEAESSSDVEAMEDDDIGFPETLSDYVISRQTFVDVFYAALYDASSCSLPISAVALSALHNVSEQYLHGALTSGNLRNQIVNTLMEEQLEASLKERAEIEEERRKVQDVEAAMVEMQAVFQRKELEMRRQIAELERQLRQQEGEPMEDVEVVTKQKTSPGKRKASSKDDQASVKGKTLTSNSIVGSLRSRLHEYSLRKKAKISPI